MRINVLGRALVMIVCATLALVLVGVERLVNWPGRVGRIRLWALLTIGAWCNWLDERTVLAMELGIAEMDAEPETGDDERPAQMAVVEFVRGKPTGPTGYAEPGCCSGVVGEPADCSWDETVWVSGGSGYPKRHTVFSQAGEAAHEAPLPSQPTAEYAAGVASNTTKAAT